MMNQQNQCANLKVEGEAPTIEKMFELQLALQKRIGNDPTAMSFMERIQFIKDNWTNLTTEYTELLERLPWKPWKKYTDEQKAGWTSKEQELETKYEFVDMFHFLMNMGLCLGITPTEFAQLYAAKNKENLDRQDRGY